MDPNAFSKVRVGDFEDEEEERKRTIATARRLYGAAQDAYATKGSNAESLKFFEQAEACLAPLLGSGLISLQPKELELVLKGRLHQAVIIAHLPDYPEQWSKVKSLVEEIMQFDYSNCHAQWLRGLALLHGFKRDSDGMQDMRRAIEYARTQGKGTEANQWEAEMHRLQAELGKKGGGDERITEIEELPEATDDVAAESEPDGRGGISDSAVASKPKARPAHDNSSSFAPGMQKGFFKKKSPKPATAAPQTTGRDSQAPEAFAEASAHLRRQEDERNTQREAELKLLRDQVRHQQGELDSLRTQLTDQQQQFAGGQHRQRHAWEEGLSAVGVEFEQALGQQQDSSGAGESISAELGRLRAVVSETGENLKIGRKWNETEHQRYMDFSTEVATLKEMAARELRERQDASRQHVVELEGSTKRFGELKSAVKVLREHVRKRCSAGNPDDDATPDMQQLVDIATDFRALPADKKLAGFLDDAAVMRLMLLFAGLGMLLALGFFIEGFGHFRCRFVCALE